MLEAEPKPAEPPAPRAKPTPAAAPEPAPVQAPAIQLEADKVETTPQAKAATDANGQPLPIEELAPTLATLGVDLCQKAKDGDLRHRLWTRQ